MLQSIRIRRSGTSLAGTRWSALLLIVTAALAGCGGGGGSAPAQQAGSTNPDGTATAASVATDPGSPSTPVSVPGGGTAGASPQNHAPTISGTPVPAVNAASSYSFVPTASDADGDSLTFSITNLPRWARFNTSTGQLSGTPTLADIGIYANIAISVSDGLTNGALAAFSIGVTQMSIGAATLSWKAPTDNTDGTPLTNLAGYKIYYGTSPSAMTQTIQITNASIASYVVENLSPATWYFAISAVANGVESGRSGTASKTIT